MLLLDGEYDQSGDMCQHVIELLKLINAGYPISLGVIEDAVRVLNKYNNQLDGIESVFKESQALVEGMWR